MKNIKLLLVGALAMSIATFAVAEDASAQAIAKKPRGGLGVSVAPSGFFNLTSAGVGQLHIPVLINKQLRVEPTLGLLRASTTDAASDQNNNTETTTTTQAIILGVGAFYHWNPAKVTAVYVGPRIGATLNSTNAEATVGGQTVTNETSRTDINLALAIGGEYFFAKTASIGGEWSLAYVITGDTTVNANGTETTLTADSGTISTNSSLIFRWYFM